jgi:hypothetical protein
MYARFPSSAHQHSAHTLWPYSLAAAMLALLVWPLTTMLLVIFVVTALGLGDELSSKHTSRHRHASATEAGFWTRRIAAAVAIAGAALIVALPATMTTPTMLFALVGMTTATLLHRRTPDVESADDPPLQRTT